MSKLNDLIFHNLGAQIRDSRSQIFQVVPRNKTWMTNISKSAFIVNMIKLSLYFLYQALTERY